MAEMEVTNNIRSIVQFLCPGPNPEELPSWPPDAFAICAFLLQKSGAYIKVVSNWPPAAYRNADGWANRIRRLGAKWRRAAVAEETPPPEVAQWWREITAHFSWPIDEIGAQEGLSDALIELMAAADEACEGVGIPDPDRQADDEFDNAASRLLRRQSSLSRRAVPSLFRVLPKLHTPQSGITIRSLSHHIALCPAGEVNPEWHYQPWAPAAEEGSNLNLLLLPWPKVISPLYFTPAEATSARLRNMPEEMGFFSYDESARTDWPAEEFKELLRKATSEIGRIDGVILPELALKSSAEFDELAANVSEVDSSIFVVAGVGGKSDENSFELNRLLYRGPTNLDDMVVGHEQHKHHRWKLDEGQIRQYDLTHRLDPYMSWWENTEIRERKLFFCAAGPWLTFALLICEDLARQDPVADILRAVGPNLVIALLMDGPQLESRWSGKYATVLADDPGSSVLSLTSIGMAQQSKGRKAADDPARSRTIALWKDARGPAREIVLPVGAEAVVLTLNRQYREEWSADGRGDDKSTAYLTYGAVHPVYPDRPGA